MLYFQFISTSEDNVINSMHKMAVMNIPDKMLWVSYLSFKILGVLNHCDEFISADIMGNHRMINVAVKVSICLVAAKT